MTSRKNQFVTSWLDSRSWSAPDPYLKEGYRFASSIFLAVVIISAMAAVALMVGVLLSGCVDAGAGPMLKFEVCNINTGEQQKPKDGEPGTVVWVSPESISAVAEITGKPCAVLRTVAGGTVFVKGAAQNVRCLLNGGVGCEQTDRRNP